MVKRPVRASAARLACGLLGALTIAEAAAVAAPTPSQPELWRGARVGDRLSGLRSRFPRALTPDHPEVLSGGELEALRLPIGLLGGAAAEALFFLRDGALAAVQLRVETLRSGSSGANVAYAHSVAAEITREVGAGYDCGDSRVAGVAQYRCRWIKGEVAVREYYLDVAGQAPVFYVAYRRADDPAFDL